METQKNNASANLPFYGKLAIVILLAVAFSEAYPKAVNYLLLLVLIGLVLGHYKQFSFLTEVLGSIGK